MREVGDPAGGNAEEAPIPPRGKQVPGAEINGQSYGIKIKVQTIKAFKKNRVFTLFVIIG
jgi:hypothetical protein